MKEKQQQTMYEAASIRDYDELIQLWEASVRSTHHFLTEDDIQYYKPLIRNEYFRAVELYIIRDRKTEQITAFMGLSDELIEMLFVHPAQQGKGLGKTLLEYAIREKKMQKVDVRAKYPSPAFLPEQRIRGHSAGCYRRTGKSLSNPAYAVKTGPPEKS